MVHIVGRVHTCTCDLLSMRFVRDGKGEETGEETGKGGRDEGGPRNYRIYFIGAYSDLRLPRSQLIETRYRYIFIFLFLAQ